MEIEEAEGKARVKRAVPCDKISLLSGPFRDTSRIVAQSETPRENQRRKGVIVRTRIRGVTRAAFGPEHRFAIRPLTWTSMYVRKPVDDVRFS